MSRIRSRTRTRVFAFPRISSLLLICIGSLLGAGCGISDRGGDAKTGAPGVPTLLYWQIADGGAVDPHAVATALQTLAPDMVVVELAQQARDVLEAVQRPPSPWMEIEVLPESDAALALLSSYPILSRQSRPVISYRMAGEKRRIRFGILDATVQCPSGRPLRILAVSIKDKQFDPAGQSEMRRNELRLVTGHVQRLMDTTPQVPILLMGALQDTPDAATLRGLIGGSPPLLQDLRPLDAAGDAWTSHKVDTDQYSRHHYLLTGIHPAPHCRIPDDPGWRALSRHRPLWLELNPGN